ncbi:DJ-1/PfpI family protein [Emticicia sp. BO119]|uniref:DJ-1/PfpI family protein n=1 Tax=Emticicia sp. BO119 TaxID=2757768 RepID=UPI0015EFFFFE|nr:DJ-1/PfpI family protein [Emticicia sp. BO119]MBA4851188.1 DJ-1/PfpI family protein [Emticicia sp. BO119]
MKSVGIFIFDDVEVLDFSGPFEIFGVAGKQGGKAGYFNVFTVAEKPEIAARNNLIVKVNYTFNNCPIPDILLIPGGGGYKPDGTPFGTRREMNNSELLEWLKSMNQKVELLLSVCTGSLILAKAGLLEGLSATTHFKAVEQMREIAPHTTLLPDERWVDNGRIILSAGVSAGIDMSLYVLSKLFGKDVANETAAYIQYDYWRI